MANMNLDFQLLSASIQNEVKVTKGTDINLTLSNIQRIIFFFTASWKPKSNFASEMLVSNIALEVHFKRITKTHTPFSSIQRTATAYLVSFMGILFITGQALYKEIGYL